MSWEGVNAAMEALTDASLSPSAKVVLVALGYRLRPRRPDRLVIKAAELKAATGMSKDRLSRAMQELSEAELIAPEYSPRFFEWRIVFRMRFQVLAEGVSHQREGASHQREGSGGVAPARTGVALARRGVAPARRGFAHTRNDAVKEKEKEEAREELEDWRAEAEAKRCAWDEDERARRAAVAEGMGLPSLKRVGDQPVKTAVEAAREDREERDG